MCQHAYVRGDGAWRSNVEPSADIDAMAFEQQAYEMRAINVAVLVNSSPHAALRVWLNALPL